MKDMPRIMILGPPKSSKSLIAQEVIQLLESKGYIVEIKDHLGNIGTLRPSTNVKELAQQHHSLRKRAGNKIIVDIIQTAKEKK